MKTAIILAIYLAILALMAAAPMLVVGLLLAGFVSHGVATWSK
jgi:hypothetical protein